MRRIYLTILALACVAIVAASQTLAKGIISRLWSGSVDAAGEISIEEILPWWTAAIVASVVISVAGSLAIPSIRQSARSSLKSALWMHPLAFVLALALPFAAATTVNAWMLGDWPNPASYPEAWPALRLVSFVTVASAALVIAAANEEFLLRGVALGTIRSQLGIAWAVGVSAVLFAVLHLEWGVYPLTWRLLGGLALAYVFLRTGSLAATTGAHVGVNLPGNLFYSEPFGFRAMRLVADDLPPVPYTTTVAGHIAALIAILLAAEIIARRGLARKSPPPATGAGHSVLKDEA